MNSGDRFGATGSDGTAWMNLVAGLWLILSPRIYRYAVAADGGLWNSVVVGVIISAVAIYRLSAGVSELAWLNALLGAWVIASPWIYGYAAEPAPTANSIIVGIIVVAVALSSVAGERAGHASASIDSQGSMAATSRSR